MRVTADNSTDLFDTLATEVWGAGERGELAQGTVASLALVADSSVLTWAVVLHRLDGH